MEVFLHLSICLLITIANIFILLPKVFDVIASIQSKDNCTDIIIIPLSLSKLLYFVLFYS